MAKKPKKLPLPKELQLFGNWTNADVDEYWNVREIKPLAELVSWLQAPETMLATLTETEKTFLQEIQAPLLDRIRDWNDEELKLEFIAPLLKKINYHTAHYKPFAERQMKLIYDEGVEISGKVEYMLAGGDQLPKKPYFFLHEYKRDTDSSGDPTGQLLIELIAAREANKEPKQTIYGCCVVGRSWYFVALKGAEYQISNGHNATEELEEIYCILKKIKDIL